MSGQNSDDTLLNSIPTLYRFMKKHIKPNIDKKSEFFDYNRVYKWPDTRSFWSQMPSKEPTGSGAGGKAASTMRDSKMGITPTTRDPYNRELYTLSANQKQFNKVTDAIVEHENQKRRAKKH